MKRGWEQGLSKGMKEGIERGLKQGLKQGMQQGIQQGERTNKKVVILNMYVDGVSMENIIKWADADENLVKAVIAEYKESRAQKKYMNKKMPTCTEDGITKYTCKKCGDTYTEVFATNSETLPEYSGRVDF